jgi:cytochrome c
VRLRGNLAALVALALAAGACALGSPRRAADTAALADERGCTGCHAAVAPPLGRPMPVAPAWNEIAARYRGEREAQHALVEAIVGGTEERHWKGSPFVSMLPHEKWVTRPDARELVRWILSR